MKRLIVCVAMLGGCAILAGAALADQHHQATDLGHPHPSQLRDGKYHFHTTPGGHKVHSVIAGGKIRAVHVTDRSGRPVAVQKVTKTTRTGSLRSLSPEDLRLASAQALGLEAIDLVSVSLPAAVDGETVPVQGGILFIGFAFYDPFLGGWRVYWFPGSWVIGGPIFSTDLSPNVAPLIGRGNGGLPV
jgi:hypothetical protein